MRTEQRVVFIARDGRDFPTKAKCLAHERLTCGAALVGLTEVQIEAARTGADPELAEAIEIFGAQLRKARQAAGQLKRRRARMGRRPVKGSAWRRGMRNRNDRIRDRASFLTPPYEEPAVMIAQAIAELCRTVTEAVDELRDDIEQLAKQSREQAGVYDREGGE